MRRRPHIGSQASKSLDELSPDPRIAFRFELAAAIVANGQKNLHQLHGVLFPPTRGHSPSGVGRGMESPFSQPDVSRTVPRRSRAPRKLAAPHSKNPFCRTFAA